MIVEMRGRVDQADICAGIDPSRTKITRLTTLVKSGEFDLGADTTVLGSLLADSLGIKVRRQRSSRLTRPKRISGRHSRGIEREDKDPAGKAKTLGRTQRRRRCLPAELIVTGIFEIRSVTITTRTSCSCRLHRAGIYGLGDAVHGISVKRPTPTARSM